MEVSIFSTSARIPATNLDARMVLIVIILPAACPTQGCPERKACPTWRREPADNSFSSKRSAQPSKLGLQCSRVFHEWTWVFKHPKESSSTSRLCCCGRCENCVARAGKLRPLIFGRAPSDPPRKEALRDTPRAVGRHPSDSARDIFERDSNCETWMSQKS